jgi:hypothetical protein
MSGKYRIYQLDPTQIILDKGIDDGMLRKDWYSHPELGECLFKEARSSEWIISDGRDARVDWSEKVVNQIANLLNLPVARYEFATGYFDGSDELIDGTISVNCIPSQTDEIFTGEQLLIHHINDYKSIELDQYTIENVLNALDLSQIKIPNNWQQQIAGIDTGAKLFVGYMMLDALTINRDRHYHNWGVMSVNDRLELIPSFDHGLSLASADRIDKSIERYVNRYKSPFQGANQQLSTFSVFERAARLYPSAARIWQEQLKQVTSTQIKEIFNRIPDGRITPTAAQFAIELLAYNQERILMENFI